MTMTDTPASTNGTDPGAAQRAATDAHAKARLERLARIAALRQKAWRVELSGGQWAELRDPERIPERLVRPLKESLAAAARMSQVANADARVDLDGGAMVRNGYVLIATFLAGWSLGTSLPTAADIEPLLDLPSRDISRLQTACSDLRDEAMEDYTPDPELTSPFVASSD